jgi:hypothetical protein
VSQSIDVIVGPDGTTRAETRGFAGPSCRTASQFLEAALGKSAAEQLTAEYYEAVIANQAIHQHQSPP